MTPLRFKPLIWIEILRRRVEKAGAYLMVLQKGDPDGGSVTLIAVSYTHLTLPTKA